MVGQEGTECDSLIRHSDNAFVCPLPTSLLYIGTSERGGGPGNRHTLI
jgi:hypothetical protein